jgi:hypothetical protein
MPGALKVALSAADIGYGGEFPKGDEAMAVRGHMGRCSRVIDVDFGAPAVICILQWYLCCRITVKAHSSPLVVTLVDSFLFSSFFFPFVRIVKSLLLYFNS